MIFIIHFSHYEHSWRNMTCACGWQILTHECQIIGYFVVVIFLIHCNALFLTLLLSHNTCTLLCKYSLWFLVTKTTSIKRDVDQCFSLDYASYSFTSSGCYSIPLILTDGRKIITYKMQDWAHHLIWRKPLTRMWFGMFWSLKV